MRSALYVKGVSARTSAESLIGVIILIALGTIAASVLIVQGRYDENAFRSSGLQKSQPGAIAETRDAPTGILSEIAPEGFFPMSDAEIFTHDDLSEKINGKADLYFECDFEELAARRFVHSQDSSLWFEVYVYDMGEPRNAFSVYSLQRRPQTPDSELAPYSYVTENALFLVHGRFYVEIVGAQASESLKNALFQAAENIIASYPSEPLIIRELSFLPRENRRDDGIKYFLKNAFGFEKMDNILTVNYDMSGKDVMAFISERRDVSEANALKEDFEKFLLVIGGKSVTDEKPPIPGMAAIDLMGDTEYIFTAGRFIAGVHAAIDRQSGDQLVRALYDFINMELQK